MATIAYIPPGHVGIEFQEGCVEIVKSESVAITSTAKCGYGMQATSGTITLTQEQIKEFRKLGQITDNNKS